MAKLSINISKIKLKDIMKKDIIRIKSNSPAGEAAKIMLKNKIHGLPVVDPENEDNLINMITSFDLLGLTYFGRFSEDTDFINKTKVEKLTEDKELVYLSPDATIKQALDFVSEKNVKTLPILEDGKLLGIVSIVDIVRTILSSGKPVEEE